MTKRPETADVRGVGVTSAARTFPERRKVFGAKPLIELGARQLKVR